jgi:hypothetical protein
MSNNESHVTVNNECADRVWKFYPPTHLKIYQYSGASDKKKVSFNQIGCGMCRNTFNKENTVQSYATSA